MAILNSTIISKLERSELFYANLVHENIQLSQIGMNVNSNIERINRIYHLITSLRFRVNTSVFDESTTELYKRLQEEIPFDIGELSLDPNYIIIGNPLSPQNGVIVDINKDLFIQNQHTISQNATYWISGKGSIDSPPTNLNDVVRLQELNNLLPEGLINQQLFITEDNTNDVKVGDQVVIGQFIKTDEELNRAFERGSVLQEEIFQSFKRFSHGGAPTNISNDLPGIASQTNSWAYNSSTKLINSTQNTNSYIGFVSTDKYLNYTNSATLTSTASDNDRIGIIIAYIEDENDLVENKAFGLDPSSFNWPIDVTSQFIPNQHTLTLFRNRNGATDSYEIWYDFNRNTNKLISSGSSLPYNTTSNWLGIEVDVKVVRNGDLITCYTTDYSDAPGGKGSLRFPITADLNSDPLLTKFKGLNQYGYGVWSQSLSSWKNINFSESNNVIYDLRNGDVYTFGNSGYVLDPNRSFFNEVGVRREIYNPYEGNLLYLESDKTIRVLSSPGLVTASNGLSNIANDIQLGGNLTKNTNIGNLGIYDVRIGGVLDESATLQIRGYDNLALLYAKENNRSSSISTGGNQGIFLQYLQADTSQRSLSINNSKIAFRDSTSNKGVVYDADYSAVGKNDDRWIPDWGSVKSITNNLALDANVIHKTGYSSQIIQGELTTEALLLGTTGLTRMGFAQNASIAEWRFYEPVGTNGGYSISHVPGTNLFEFGSKTDFTGAPIQQGGIFNYKGILRAEQTPIGSTDVVRLQEISGLALDNNVVHKTGYSLQNIEGGIHVEGNLSINGDNFSYPNINGGDYDGGYDKFLVTNTTAFGGRIQYVTASSLFSNFIYARKDNPSLIKYNAIGGSPRVNPIFSVDPSGWDQQFGEKGNVIKVGNTLVTCYSGSVIPYTSNNVYTGIAISTDNGKTWVKEGLNGDGRVTFPGNSSEDPYIVYDNGIYYLFVEDKNAVPFRNIKMYTSTDRKTFIDRGVVLDIGAPGTFEGKDVSSPTVIIRENTFYLYYEGRTDGVGGQQGMVGLATAPVSLTPTFTKYAGNPIIQGSNGTTIQIPFGINIVPDDILKIDDSYYMTCHIYNGINFVEGILVSSDGFTWVDYLGSWLINTNSNTEINGAGVSLYFNGSQYVVHYLNQGGTGISEGFLTTQTSQYNGNKIGTFGGLNLNPTYTMIDGNPFNITAVQNSSLFALNGGNINVTHGAAGTGGALTGLNINVNKSLNTGTTSATGINLTVSTGARASGSTIVTHVGYNSVVTGSSATTSTASNQTYRGGYFEAKSLTAVGETSIVEGVHGKASGLSGMTTKGGVFEASGGTNNYGVDIITGSLHLTPLTASTSLILDASKNVVSNTNTGTGSSVLSVSPALTGTPIAPTATVGTNTTQIATTAFVTTAVSNTVSPVVDITGTTQAGVVNTKYYANNVGLVTITLPTTATQGQQFLVRGKGAGGWKIAQNAGQTIHGATDSTTGVTGSIASQARYDTVALECMTNNTDWVIIANRGTLTIT